MTIANISLRQVAYLVAVADHGSMTAAAEASQVSQASISLGINDLERRLGARLLQRHPGQGVTLTDAGESAVRDARRVLAAVGDLQSSARSPEHRIRGRVALGCFTTLAPFYLPPLFSSFATLHPAVEIEVTEGSQQALRRALLEGTCELALTYDTGLGAGIARSRIVSGRAQVLLAAGHALAQRQEIDLRDLADERLILLELDPSPTNAEKLLHERGLEADIAYRSPSIEVVRSMVAHGLGYTILVQHWALARSVDGLPVVSRPITGPAPAFRVVAAWNENNPPTPRSAAVIAGLRQVAADRDSRVEQPSPSY
ncbi:LysR substrate-binding domain-containing protein [Streptomyces sp. NPDC059255]|uniref:LysR substrate-binding domain-containing protein n=1 Tax=Streptomyces sp. NPDC059255 TaxID=3346793 RepID=UPI0036A4D759